MLVAGGFCDGMLVSISLIQARSASKGMRRALRDGSRIPSLARRACMGAAASGLPMERMRMRSHRTLEHLLDTAERVGVGERDGQVAEEKGGIDPFVGAAGPWQGGLPVW